MYFFELNEHGNQKTQKENTPTEKIRHHLSKMSSGQETSNPTAKQAARNFVSYCLAGETPRESISRLSNRLLTNIKYGPNSDYALALLCSVCDELATRYQILRTDYYEWLQDTWEREALHQHQTMGNLYYEGGQNAGNTEFQSSSMEQETESFEDSIALGRNDNN